jgi:hypothetical protein
VENKRCGQNRMGSCREGFQGQTCMALVLKEEEKCSCFSVWSVTTSMNLSDFGNTFAIDIGLLLWQPFKKGHFHFRIILASVFITTLDPHTLRIEHYLLLSSFRWELPRYPPCSSDRCRNAW